MAKSRDILLFLPSEAEEEKWAAVSKVADTPQETALEKERRERISSRLRGLDHGLRASRRYGRR